MKISLSRKKLLLASAICTAILLPATARAGVADIISLLTTITTTLKTTVGTVLTDIEAINTKVRDFEQTALWPVSLIKQTRSEVLQLHAQLASAATEIESINIRSAHLPHTQDLELVLGSGATNLDRIGSSYATVYQQVPATGQVGTRQRNVLDTNDALALSGLKTATVSDQSSKQILVVADGLEQQAALSAPGSASILTAQAQAANLQSQAMLHRLLATELRVEAANLAHINAKRKQSADDNRDLRQQLQRTLGGSR
ncbi:MAG: hypothetical protein JOZ10_00185 [Acidobacteria bacterium]|nr:hypothetical protein [Acidobacteriota bacterium]